MKRVFAPFAFCLVAFAAASTEGAEVVRLTGLSSAAKAFQAAAPGIKRDLDIDLKFDPQSLSGSAIHAVGAEVADVAVITRGLTPEDRSDFPSRRFFEIEVGVQVVVPIVSRETFESGVKSISKKEFADLYEGTIRNWKQLGGEDREIKFFNPEQGRGVWELFVTWLYGDIRKAPLGKRWENVLTNQDARDSVEFNSGSISLAPIKWADGKRVVALALRDEGGVIEPTVENIRSRKWPITRPLVLVSGNKPTGAVRHLLSFMVGPSGREALEKAEFVSLPDAEAKLNEQ
jgi:phosphate transport system substrate-binding protein